MERENTSMKIGSGIVLLGLIQSMAACGATASSDATDRGQGGSSNVENGNEGGGENGQDPEANGGDAGDDNGGLACATECDACPNGFELVKCQQDCVCESTDSAAKTDHELLLECAVDEPCPDSVVSQDPGSTTWDNGDCLLSALRDRTPGRYTHSSTISDIGGTTVEYTLLLDGSDDLIVSAVSTSWGPGTRVRYDKTQRCSLVSYELLDDCLATGTDLSPTTTGGGPSLDEACTMLGDWTLECEEIEASCPAD